MGDTIIDEPHRPTLDEHVGEPVPSTEPHPEIADDAPAKPPRPRRPRAPLTRARIIAIVASILAAVIVVASVAIYLFVIRYEPRAQKHVPGNANFVARVELADVALFAPVRKHLWPLLFDGKKSDALAKKTGVTFATDVREMVIASLDATSWVAIAGGKIKKGHVVDGLAAVADEEHWSGFHRDGDFLVGPGVVIAQCDDGTLVAGTDKSIVSAALPTSDEYQRLGLPEGHALAFAMTREAFSGGPTQLAREIDRAYGSISLTDAPKLDATFEPAPGVDPAALAREIDGALANLRLATMLSPDVAGEKGALTTAKVTPTKDAVSVSADWPYDGLDRGCDRLARLLSPR